MPASRQQKCGLVFAATCSLLFGGGIIVCGVLFDQMEPYDADAVNGKSYDVHYEYYYTQYWLGIPLFVLGLLLLLSACCTLKPLLVLCILLSTLTIILSIASVVLEGPKWRTWISIRRWVVHNDEKEVNGTCQVPPSGGYLGRKDDPLSCREVYYATLMQSVIVACSIIGIVISQFAVFVSMRLLGWMSRGSYDLANKDNHPQFNSGGSAVVIMSEM